MLNHKVSMGIQVALLIGVTGASAIMAGCSQQSAVHTNDAAATAAAVPSQTPTPASQSVPTAAVPPTVIPVTPTALPTAVACQPTVQVTDLAVPDRSPFRPGEVFVKVWRFLNSGNCAWEKGWTLVFQNGEKFSAPDTVPISVADVGKSVEVSMTMKAPQSPGTYVGLWALQPPSGQAITVADVSIVVFIPTPTRAPTPVAPVAKPTARAPSGSIPPVGSGMFAVDSGAWGPMNCVRISEGDWAGEFQVIVSGGPGNYVISDPGHCQWNYAIQRFVCRYVSRFDASVNQVVYVSCPGCTPEKVIVSGRATLSWSGKAPRGKTGCPVHPGPWGIPSQKEKD